MTRSHGSGGAGAASARPLGGDLMTSGHFLFELDGVEIGVFREVRGLEVTVAVDEIREGGQNGFIHRVPQRMTWPNVVLRRGLTDSNELFEWLTRTSGEGFAASGNKLARSTGAITALDGSWQRQRTWELIDVYPVRWQGPSFASGSEAPLEEELEITHHGFRAKDLT